jgi:hypothetical protein
MNKEEYNSPNLKFTGMANHYNPALMQVQQYEARAEKSASIQS